MRKLLAVLLLLVLSGGIMAMFWYNEWVYSLPTPVPAHYKPVNPGDHITVPATVKYAGNKPLFLHFFNPQCPCSKFNVPHFASLAKQYGNDANFAIVLLSDKKYDTAAIQEKFGLVIPVIADSAVAAACGVYSTPQAVIIDTAGKLYYRGNYNKSRYCADKKTAYARIALEGLLHKNYNIPYEQFALKAYGCRLPDCKGK